MQLNFRIWLIIVFSGINLIAILFFSRFAYQKLEESILDKTKDQLTSINILKKRHIEFYLENKIAEVLHFINYAESHHSNDTTLMELLLNAGEIKGVAIVRENNLTVSGKAFSTFASKEVNFNSEDSISLYLNDAVYENQSLLHVVVQRATSVVHVFFGKEGLKNIVLERSGMGTTGESYIVNNEFKMQTPSRFFPDSIPETITAGTVGVQRALEGKSGIDIYDDYRSIPIIGAYRQLNFHNLNLVLLTEIDFDEAMEGILSVRNYLIVITISMILVALLISIAAARLLTRPISVLKNKSAHLAKGIIPGIFDKESPIKEINEINSSINNLIHSLKHTIQFASEIGKENYETDYKPLSDKDELGRAVLEMRNKLLILNQQKQLLETQRKKDLVNTQEMERERIARDIHDGIGPLLTTTKMKISILDINKNIKNELLGLIDNTIKEIRGVSRNLMPGVLIDFGPAEAIKGMVEEIRKTTGFNITFISEISADNTHINKEKGIALFRIAQEAINNALRHSESTEIKVTLTEFDEYVSLFVKDNGHGFDQKAIQNSQGKGLRNIEERVNISGGKFYIESGKNGTSLEIEIPRNNG